MDAATQRTLCAELTLIAAALRLQALDQETYDDAATAQDGWRQKLAITLRTEAATLEEAARIVARQRAA